MEAESQLNQQLSEISSKLELLTVEVKKSRSDIAEQKKQSELLKEQSGALKSQGRKIRILMALLAVVTAAGIYFNNNSINKQNTEKAQARIAACQQYNVQQENLRNALKGSVLALRSFETEASKDRLESFISSYGALVDEGVTDRDCSPAGITAYYDSSTQR